MEFEKCVSSEAVEERPSFLNALRTHRAISSTKEKVEVRLKNGKMRRTLGASAVQGEIQECRQALSDALKDLDVSRTNTPECHTYP